MSDTDRRDAVAPIKNNKSALLSALSNFTIQYNYQAITVALLFMKQIEGGEYGPSEPEESLLKSMVFVGSICGQLSMGYAGDWWGRRKAMILTSLLVVLGSLGSALTTFGERDTVYEVLVFWRFVLGFGVGGKYPLSATMRSEGTDTSTQHTSTEVARVFFWQTPGTVVPYLLGMLLCAAIGHLGGDAQLSHTQGDLMFRIVLGLGSVTSIVSTVLLISEPESAAYKRAQQSSKSLSPFKVAKQHPELWRLVVGTGMTWFFFDIVIYGCSLNQPSILIEVFGKKDGMFDDLWQNALINVMALTGVGLGVMTLRAMGSKQQQAWGLSMMCAVAIALSLIFHFECSAAVKFVVYGLLIISLNWGPNVSTYVIPTEVYPIVVRSSFFGLSAAMGKAGATIGSAYFKPLKKQIGTPWLFAFCAFVSLAGVVTTHWFIKPYGKGSLVPLKLQDVNKEDVRGNTQRLLEESA